jgi:hypothetical protein
MDGLGRAVHHACCCVGASKSNRADVLMNPKNVVKQPTERWEDK